MVGTKPIGEVKEQKTIEEDTVESNVLDNNIPEEILCVIVESKLINHAEKWKKKKGKTVNTKRSHKLVMRKKREQIKFNDPTKYEEIKRKDRERGKVTRKLVKDMTLKERQAARRNWRIHSKKHKLVKKMEAAGNSTKEITMETDEDLPKKKASRESLMKIISKMHKHKYYTTIKKGSRTKRKCADKAENNEQKKNRTMQETLQIKNPTLEGKISEFKTKDKNIKINLGKVTRSLQSYSKYRGKLKSDPQRYEEALKKDRDRKRIMRRRIGNMNEEEKKKMREKWRISSQRHRKSMKEQGQTMDTAKENKHDETKRKAKNTRSRLLMQKYREKLKSDPQKHEESLVKDRERQRMTQRRIENMSEEEKIQMRKKWRIATQKHRELRKEQEQAMGTAEKSKPNEARRKAEISRTKLCLQKYNEKLQGDLKKSAEILGKGKEKSVSQRTIGNVSKQKTKRKKYADTKKYNRGEVKEKGKRHKVCASHVKYSERLESDPQKYKEELKKDRGEENHST